MRNALPNDGVELKDIRTSKDLTSEFGHHD